MDDKKLNVKDVIRMHSAKIESQMYSDLSVNTGASFSNAYDNFKREMAPELTRYERWCHSLGNIVKLNVAEKDRKEIEKHLKIAHLDLEPWQPLTLSVMTFVGIFLFGLISSVGVTFILSTSTGRIGEILSNFPVLYFFLMVIVSLFLFYFVNGIPQRLANKWRLKASSQMVPAILYVVVYMRHTANLEKAIAFASNHLQYPLALDFKKIFYDVEVRRFSTIKESLDNYLETWRGYSNEFIESFHLIESSLYEPDNSRRIATLDKALQVVLEGVYDKMLRFTHSVRSPLTNVYMLGVVLPTLGLALLPLASAMLGGLLKWYHIFLLFNVVIPFLVFYLTDNVMILRPGGYGESSLLERNRLYSIYTSSKHYTKAFLVCFPFFVLGFLPLIFQFSGLPGLIGLQTDYTFNELGFSFFGDEKIFGFEVFDKKVNGPFGIGAVMLGMLIPLSVALFFSIAYKSKTKELILEREKTRQLETEFNNSLFSLGNRLGDGVPPELVFGKVAESSRGLITEDFFRRVNYNIRQGGMDVDKAIFDRGRGAINYFPSDLIATSMRVLIESAKKGLNVAAISLMSISQYVKNIQKITERLRDMLAEIISDMKSNMTFLAPLLSGIVVGLAVMITSILTKLNLADLATQGAGVGGLDAFMNIFKLAEMVPPYYLQIAIGIYLIQIIFILTKTLVAIDSGEDKLEKANKTGDNLGKGIVFYFVVAFLSTLLLFILTTIVLGGFLS